MVGSVLSGEEGGVGGEGGVVRFCLYYMGYGWVWEKGGASENYNWLVDEIMRYEMIPQHI